MAIELGGNIVLQGFDDKDFTEMVVIKKMVGQYARQLADSFGKVNRLSVTLKDTSGTSAVTTVISLEGKECSASESAENLYVALDTSLKNAAEKAK